VFWKLAFATEYKTHYASHNCILSENQGSLIAKFCSEHQVIGMKLVMVGDVCTVGGEGTKLLIHYVRNGLPSDYIPIVFDNLVVSMKVGNTLLDVGLWDTSGQREYERLRPLSYANCDVFLVAFSIVDRSTFDAVTSTWVPEIHHFCPSVPFVLAGIQSDLRNDPTTLQRLTAAGHSPVTTAEGIQLARKLASFGCQQYVECSVNTGENVRLCFEMAVRAVLLNACKKKQKQNCLLC